MGNLKNSFIEEILNNRKFHASTMWFYSQCTEARGMQKLWEKSKPELLKKLKEFAKVQSTESSNRIEGVEVDKDRLLPLVLKNSRPRDRSEEEIFGYKEALNYIHEKHSELNISPRIIKNLHKICQGGMIGDAGEWKERDNEIIEFGIDGEKKVRFKCVKAEDVPKAVENLCDRFNDSLNQNKIVDLIAIADFVLDFLCIHPFRDGNGRTSRLLTLLLLYKANYYVGTYISLERIIETTKEDYYRVLYESSQEWHEAKHNLMPWENYFLSVIKNAYQELKDKIETSHSYEDTKTANIKNLVLAQDVLFAVSDICKLQPSLDRELIKKVIFSLRDEGKLKSVGQGRGAKWKVV